MIEHRRLTFDRLDQVMPEVDRLLNGYQGMGQWTLGQICRHLAETMRFSVEVFPDRGSWLVRRTVGPLVLAYLMRKAPTMKKPPRAKAPSYLEPKPGLDDRAEAEALRATIRLFEEHKGPMPEHPIFGRISKDGWTRIHCFHAAHHLGFTRPITLSESNTP